MAEHCTLCATTALSMHYKEHHCRTSALSAIVGGSAAVQRYLQLAAVPEASCSADA